MGGGSTEIVRFEGDTLMDVVSLPIGCVMLGKRYTACTKKDPFPTDAEMQSIRAYVKGVLSQYPAFRSLGGTAFLIGGTAKAAAKLENSLSQKGFVSEGYRFTDIELKKTTDTAFDDIRSGGKWLKENVPDRISSIIPGLSAYAEICDYMMLSDFIISGAGVREGYLIDFIRKNDLRKTQES